jgi:hypothetical protein
MNQTQRTGEDQEKLQKALDAVEDCATKWGLEFNIGKCKVTHVGLHNNHHQYSRVEMTDNLKLIHIAAKLQSSSVTAIPGFPLPVPPCVYQALQKISKAPTWNIIPGMVTMEGGQEGVQGKVQKTAVGMVTCLQNRDHDERWIELGLQTLEERRHQADMHVV